CLNTEFTLSYQCHHSAFPVFL
ncbi:TPA: yecR-like lipofamily protein, partial [Shigella flexneri]|nr:yecR-like lipofamily protein [Escherichia coli]EFQ0608001.1 yecR-like lipofamily protein [Shigella boydii]HAY5166800.1 yecR-like lipofamily protein [Shigella flexneri]HAY5257282.1 yecR-like lipofamily protein [Shigella flexneri]HAY5317669.1 yecR-like lipofamily protein [Shigella flexneri]